MSLLAAAGCGGVTTQTDIIGPSASRCAVSATAGTRTLSHTGGTVTVSVSTARDCEWSVQTDASWITLTPSSGLGNGSVRVTVAPNQQTSARTGRLVVNDSNLELVQQAAPPPPPPPPPPAASPPSAPSPPSSPPQAPTPPPPPPSPAPAPPAPTPPAEPENCSFELNRSSETFNASGGDGEVKVRAKTRCSWEARSRASWISITSGGSGSGDGEVRYRVAQHTSEEERTGTLSIAGQTFTVQQRGAEPPRPERVDVEGPAAGVSGSCPSLSFSVRGAAVTTDSSTKFKRDCGDLKSGVKVRVRGERTGSGPIRASEVEIER